MPWSAGIIYQRPLSPPGQWPESVCADNPHEYYAGKENVRIPGYGPEPNYRGKGLQLEFTVEDEGVFTTRWSATVTYLRAAIEWPEIVCAENPHEYYAGKDASVPKSDKLDF